MRPEITGDTAKGRSMRVVSRLLPRKLCFAMSQEAAMPKTTLAGTAIAAVTSVSLIALRASGSVNAAKKAPHPLRNASVKTAASGSTRKHATNVKAIVMNTTFTHQGLRMTRGPIARPGAVLPAREVEAPPAMSDLVKAPAPLLDQIDQQEEDEGGDEHDHRDRRSAVVVVLLELRDDEQRDDLAMVGLVARDENDGAVFAQRASKRHGEARDQRRCQLGQDNARHRLPAVRAQGGGGLLQLRLQFGEHRLERAHDKREADERQGDEDAGPVEGQLVAQQARPVDPR